MMTAPDPADLSIVLHPHPTLRETAQPVDAADPAVAAVAARMIQLMHEAPGVGLAAPQVGLPWRLFVTHAGEADPVNRVFINPRITLGRPGESRPATESSEEGCLSLPGIEVTVRRPVAATIEAEAPGGERFELSAEGFVARVWQHEYDHLDGVLLLDRMGPRDRLSNRRAIRSLEAGDV